MKVSYFGYYLKNIECDTETLFDLRPLLKAFTRSSNDNLKKSFMYNGENIYLKHMLDDTFLFIGTKSDEIIKKIDTNNLSISEINQLLNNNEKLGFASYIIMKDNFFGYGSTMLAPRIGKFIDFVNHLLSYINHSYLLFCVEPLLSQVTRQDALDIPVLGKTTIEFSKDTRVGRNFLSFMGVDTDHIENIGNIEVKIKPISRGKNIKEAIDSVLNYDELNEFEKVIIKAKDEASTALTELYLIGRGAISDSIKTDNEIEIPNILKERIANNLELTERVERYAERESFQVEIDLCSLDLFSDSNNWDHNN